MSKLSQQYSSKFYILFPVFPLYWYVYSNFLYFITGNSEACPVSN